jgi:hypothetical protein
VPASFDCGDVDGNFAAPEIGQAFCIGDGLSFADEPQTFFIPDGATRLFLGHAERRTNQVLEAAVHHLGDNYGTAGLFALDPNPEGRCFWTNFDMPSGFTPSGARVRLDLAGTDIGSNSVWVNGQQIAYLPNTGYTAWLEDRAFTVNLSLLQPTGNQVGICSNGGNLDDFLFKNLRFEVAPPVVVQPEPSDPTPYHLGDLRGQFVGDGVGTGDWGLFANMPIPYGKSWTSPSFAVESPETLAGASLLFDIAQTDINNNPVYVNGTWVGNLPIRRDGTVWSAEEFPFDPALLKEFGNRIEMRSGNLFGYVEVDDFMMRNVRLAVAQQDAAPPGGYADNTGFQELVIDFGSPVDSDGDGLTDAQEAALGTNPDEPDSDFDGIIDFVEVNMDGNPDNYTPGQDTDPNNEDTDNDGIRDGDEVQNGTNPNDDADYPGNGDFDSDGVLDAADLLGCTRIALRLAQEPVDAVESMRCDAAPLDGSGAPQLDQHVGAGDLLVIQRRLLQLQ